MLEYIYLNKGKQLKSRALTRRVFLGATLAAGAGAFLYFNAKRPSKTGFYANEMQVVLHVSYHLFPHSKLGPGAVDLHVSNYLINVFRDNRLLKEENERFLKGAFWVEESSFEIYNKSFLNLSSTEKEKLLQSVTRDRWGENFVYTCLNYIFEALLSSPLYGSNPKEVGWTWLQHDPGFPQPINLEDISYEV